MTLVTLTTQVTFLYVDFGVAIMGKIGTSKYGTEVDNNKLHRPLQMTNHPLRGVVGFTRPIFAVQLYRLNRQLTD